MTDPLSPPTRAVYDAFNRIGLYNEPSFDTDRRGLAAAFRAAATQVTPLSTNLRQNKIRYELLAIADELEGVTYGTYRSDLTDQPQ
jgi:hypothetical protein